MPTYMQDTVNELQPKDDGDHAFIRNAGAKVAEIVVDSAELIYTQRAKNVSQRKQVQPQLSRGHL